MSNLENCSFFAFFERAITLSPSSLRKSERAIALFVALFERATALLVALLKRAKKE